MERMILNFARIVR